MTYKVSLKVHCGHIQEMGDDVWLCLTELAMVMSEEWRQILMAIRAALVPGAAVDVSRFSWLLWPVFSLADSYHGIGSFLAHKTDSVVLMVG